MPIIARAMAAKREEEGWRRDGEEAALGVVCHLQM